MVPDRDSSLYDFITNGQNQPIYSRFRPLIPATSVPNLSSTANIRCNSNSSSNEADEELSLSSMNSNQILGTTNSTEENGIGIYMTPSISLSTTNMSTFKTASINHLPSKPSEVKRRSNHRKQISAALNLNTNNNNNNNSSSKTIENEIAVSLPPPAPPFPKNFESIKKKTEHQISSTEPEQTQIESISTTITTNNFQMQIEQAKNRLKKINVETSPNTILSSKKTNEWHKSTHQNTSGN